MLAAAMRQEKTRLVCKPVPKKSAGKENQTGLSTIPSFKALERRRIAEKISTGELVAEARLDRMNYFLLKRGAIKPRASTLRRIAAALDRLRQVTSSRRLPALLAAFVKSAEIVIAAEIGDDAELIAAVAFKRYRKRPPAAVEPQRLRTLAIYFIAVELQVDNPELARALGCKRQNIKQIRDDIYELVDGDKAVEDLFDRCAAKVKGDN